jgi:uncharacterized repeat protein (TIGR03803 family)
MAFSGAASAGSFSSFSSIYQFQGGSDGANPRATLLSHKGSLYGVTTAAGAGSGTFFSLTPPAAPGGAWSETALMSFVSDDIWPSGDLALYKTGFVGTKIEDPNPSAAGSLYQLKLTATVPSVWKEITIHSFGGPGDGWTPGHGLTKLGSAYYGVTGAGGVAGCQAVKGQFNADGCGVVYKAVPPVKPGGAWTETVLYAFAGGADGANPGSDLFQYQGNFYGVTQRGGWTWCTTVPDSLNGCGTFFEISPQGVKTTLYAFEGDQQVSTGKDGAGPQNKLTRVGDAFYGITYYGGGTGCGGNGCGTVYRLKPPVTPGGPWIEKVMYIFQGGSDGAFPGGGLVSSGSYVYGTTTNGGGTGCGGNGCGTVFKIDTLTPGVDTIIHAFQGGSDGAYPFGSMLHTASGLIGTTEFGGNASCNGGRVLAGFPGCGTAFQVH